MLERTLSIVKPDAVERGLTGRIISRIEEAGLRVVAYRRLVLNRSQASSFYGVHRERPFFDELVTFMVSGPILAMILEGEDAIARNRAIMGATDPRKAEKGTIRADFALSIGANAVHGSDSPESATREISFFFAAVDVID